MLADTFAASFLRPVRTESTLDVVLAHLEQVPRRDVANVEVLDRDGRRRPEEISAFGEVLALRARGVHVDPACRAARRPEPRVLHADGDQAARARRQPVAAAVENQRRIAGENVEALLERLHVCVDVAAGVELGEAPARVHGADGAVRQCKAPVARRMPRKSRSGPGIRGANEVMQHVVSPVIHRASRRVVIIRELAAPRPLAAGGRSVDREAVEEPGTARLDELRLAAADGRVRGIPRRDRRSAGRSWWPTMTN